MTDDDLQLFITLKYSSIDEAIEAFSEAINSPEGYITEELNEAISLTGIRKWAEAGCPDKMAIADEDVVLFLEIKFGSLHAAHQWWLNTPPGSVHGLSKKEVLAVMDYVNIR